MSLVSTANGHRAEVSTIVNAERRVNGKLDAKPRASLSSYVCPRGVTDTLASCMTGDFRRSMACDRSQNGDVRDITKTQSERDQKADSPLGVTEEDDSILVIPDSLLASTDLEEKKRHRPHFLQPHGPDGVDPPRSTSWPAVPRSQAVFPLQKRIESFQRRSDRLKAARERAFSIRMELKFLRSNYRQQHKWVDESQRNLNDHIERMMKSDDFITTRDDYLLYYGRARDDYLRLEEQSSKLQARENDLTILEESIERQETQLKQTSDRILGVLRHLDPTTRDEGEERDAVNTLVAPSEHFSSEDDGDRAGTTSSLGDPLLDDYFDKAGNVKVAKGRLLEVFKEHEEKRADRIHQQDQGVELLDSDADFEHDCETERKAAEKAIHDAILLRDNAKATCRKNGIDPDLHRHTSEILDDVVDGIAAIHSPQSQQPPPTRLHLSHTDHPGPSTIVTKTGPFGEAMVDDEKPDLPPVVDTVERWFESMDQQINESLEQVRPEENTPRKESPSRLALLTHELEPYFAKREDAETIAQLVARRLEPTPLVKLDAEQLAQSTGSYTSFNHSRSSSESRLTAFVSSKKASSQLAPRMELHRYLLEHGSAEVIAQLSNLGIELPQSTKENIDHMATKARSALSDHSRASSESRISVRMKTDIPRTELLVGISEPPRGRRP